ncbi:hypothetical protein PGT21_005046 [Puccinia graminis f. sp. tritici]|uniref:CxC1-like cysteine cluster associated with KDZ transposases domain-containing protein n=1 Tax=Puccinia graminis f. sp. tritici TaxID=56615 RepID=A0A5B0QI12_PUCGR|nr:hypothetical protein PGT21_005046 [Puccinia graminis f. sp. tritici]
MLIFRSEHATLNDLTDVPNSIPEDQLPSQNQFDEEIRWDSVDPQVEQLHQYMQSQAHSERRETEEKNWKEAYEQMFPAFYQSSAATSNWGDLDKWNHDFTPSCACDQIQQRPVVLVDLLTRKQQEIRFCECQHDQVRLVSMGYIGGSPKYPRTAFSIRLLRFHHIIWKNSAIPMHPFAKALDEFLDANNPLILSPHNGEDSNSSFSTREWRRTLSSAVDAYREMIRREQLM